MINKLEFHEFMAGIRPQTGKLPFYIGIHTFPVTVLNYHSFVEFTYIIAGSGYQSINGTMHRIEPGSVSFALPYHIHQTISDKGAVIQKYCCQFDISLLFGSPYISEWFGRMYQVGTHLPSTAAFCGEEAVQIEQLFARLLYEYRNADLPGRNNMICNKLSEAMIMYLRKAEADEQTVNIMEQDISDELFWKALHFVHMQFAKRLTLDMIASYLHISATYVSRLFREKTGRSFLEYVHQLRVNSAASMLITSDRPIIDIAFQTGFESIRTFYRVFREVKGHSPREYRNEFI